MRGVRQLWLRNPSPKAKVDDLKRSLVDGVQVITGECVLSGSGHLSARIPGTETFLINPRFAGVLADPKDICTVNFDAKRIAAKGRFHQRRLSMRRSIALAGCRQRDSLSRALLDPVGCSTAD